MILLETPRLTLRQLTLNDAGTILRLRNDEQVAKYLDRVPMESEEEARKFINRLNDNASRNESYIWAITLKGWPELVGTICLWNFSKYRSSAEAGYEMFPAFQGKGIMNEALNAVISHGFTTLDLHSIAGWTHPENKASIKLLEKNGFIRNTALEEKFASANEQGNHIIFQLERK